MMREQQKLMQEISYLSSKLASTEAGYEKLKEDIDSRVCENCKYWSQEYVNLGICQKEVDTERIDDLSDWCTVGSFGCNRFERKLESK